MMGRVSSFAYIALAALVGGCSAGGGSSNPQSSGSGGSGGSGGDAAATSGPGATGSGSGATGSASSSGNGAGGGGAGGSDGGVKPPAVCPGGPYEANPLPGDKNAKKIQGGFHFTEGPVWIEQLGALLFSDFNFSTPNPPPLNGPRGVIMKFTPPGSFEVFIDGSSSNGLGIDLQGNLLACTHDTRGISVFDLKTKARKPLVEGYMGKKFNSPNDLVMRSDGNLYFSDPDWQLSGGAPSELPMAVYRVSPKGEVSVIDKMNKPNGVTLSPDESTLYVGAIDSKIRKYTLSADGVPGPASDFANTGGADSMAMDCAGNLYVAGGGGVDVFAPSGTKLGTITGSNGTTNMAFGGPARKTLYITGGDSLYAIDLNVPGYPY
jgi:gluconolactonase